MVFVNRISEIYAKNQNQQKEPAGTSAPSFFLLLFMQAFLKYNMRDKTKAPGAHTTAHSFSRRMQIRRHV